MRCSSDLLATCCEVLRVVQVDANEQEKCSSQAQADQAQRDRSRIMSEDCDIRGRCRGRVTNAGQNGRNFICSGSPKLPCQPSLHLDRCREMTLRHSVTYCA